MLPGLFGFGLGGPGGFGLLLLLLWLLLFPPSPFAMLPVLSQTQAVYQIGVFDKNKFDMEGDQKNIYLGFSGVA